MKMYLRKAMQNVATYVELALSAFLTIVIVVLIVKLIGESFFHLNGEGPELSYYLESAMTLAIGIEFVKMLCTHTPGTITFCNLKTDDCGTSEWNRNFTWHCSNCRIICNSKVLIL